MEGIPDRETGQAVVTDLQLAGFINVMAAKDGEVRFVVAQRPG